MSKRAEPASLLLLLVPGCVQTYRASIPVAPSPAERTPGSSLADLPLAKPFRAYRSSSHDRTGGNADYRRIEPGETLAIADLEGPGEISHLWVTIASGDRWHLRNLVLRAYFDGAKTPCVESPIGDFFGLGHGRHYRFISEPLAVGNDKGLNCFFPMPFRASARVEVTNESHKPVRAFYFYVDWRKFDSPRALGDRLVFHARYRQERPPARGADYRILEARGRGHFVGCILNVWGNEPSWWGEGDDKFYVDDEETPSLYGTGTEDYLGHAWGMGAGQSAPFFGSPLGGPYEVGVAHSSYRFHIPDPVPFTRSLRVEIEHKGPHYEGDRQVSPYDDRTDDLSSVAYWYQSEPHADLEPFPPARDRLPGEAPFEISGEDFVERAKSSGEKVEAQWVYSERQLWFRSDSEGDWVEIAFPVEREGRYALSMHATKASDYGVFRALLDESPCAGPYDAFNAEGGEAATHVAKSERIALGEHELRAGEHRLRFEIVGKNDRSSGHLFGLSSLFVIPAP